MTSFRRMEANRRNALKSTGPKTAEGKEASRRNAVRHGLTAETVIGELEDAEDYRAFEAAITADYDAQSAIERELVLRLASLLWRLRRATTIETGLFGIQAEHVRDYRHSRELDPESRKIIYALFGQAPPSDVAADSVAQGSPDGPQHPLSSSSAAPDSAADLTWCFLRLANLPSCPLDRLSRYETALWRQAGQILFALDGLDRRKPQDRRPRVRLGFQSRLLVDPDAEG